MSRPFSPVRAILRKREGEEHPPGEIESLIEEFVSGRMNDYQMTAWMMAVLFRGMTRDETARLTRAMIGSGDKLPSWGKGGAVVDKHSTGGVGDKVSLVAAPLAAACGLRVPMISGRSLGHTGGTLDKLESIPGYQTDLTVDRFREIVRRIGVSIAGATERLVPADRRMYALRDVSGIVESPPLIVASILSKKAAAGLDGLTLDVKVGSGGFMSGTKQARSLARSLCDASLDLGMRVQALLTDMTAPLGRTVGNSLEVREAIELLQGTAHSARLLDVCLQVTESMLHVASETDSETASRRVETALRSGRGLERFAKMIEEHGGDPRVAEDPSRLPCAPIQYPVVSGQTGWVTAIDPRAVGELVIDLGGGRRHVGEAIDPGVGIVLAMERGTHVEKGQPLAMLHLREDQDAKQFARRLHDCYSFGSSRPRHRSAVIDRL